MKISDLSGALLDYWVARAEGFDVRLNEDKSWAVVTSKNFVGNSVHSSFAPSSRWYEGGPIIERERAYMLNHYAGRDAVLTWTAEIRGSNPYEGATALIACMRAFVASKFGDEVPDEASQ